MNKLLTQKRNKIIVKIAKNLLLCSTWSMMRNVAGDTACALNFLRNIEVLFETVTRKLSDGRRKKFMLKHKRNGYTFLRHSYVIRRMMMSFWRQDFLLNDPLFVGHGDEARNFEGKTYKNSAFFCFF